MFKSGFNQPRPASHALRPAVAREAETDAAAAAAAFSRDEAPAVTVTCRVRP